LNIKMWSNDDGKLDDNYKARRNLFLIHFRDWVKKWQNPKNEWLFETKKRKTTHKLIVKDILSTGGHLIEFHLIESVDQKFLII
jgi:hypothetical protein